ncbi:MAG: glycosyl hydrolase, partial [Flavobacteriia bacterium]
KSTDGGKTWKKTGLEFNSPNSSANEIIINPKDSKILWVATNRGFYRTEDSGENWRRKLSGNIRDIKMRPNDPTTIYAVTSSEFYKSTDGGVNFSKITSNLPASSSRMTIGVSPANANIVYVLSATNENSFNGIYRSTDSGTTFKKTNEDDDIFGGSKQAWYDMAMTVSPTDPNTLFVGVLDIWKSTNGGNDFKQLNRWWDVSLPNYTHADIHFLRYYNLKLYAGTDGGIYESKDNGKNFTELTENLVISQYYRISTAKTSKDYVVGGLQDNGGFGYSNNAWYRYHGGDGMDCAIDPKDQNIYYGFTQHGSSLNISYNAGVSSGGQIAQAPEDEVDEDNHDSGGSWVTPLVINRDGDILAGYRKLYKLNENNTWEAVSDAVFGGDLNNIRVSKTDPNLIYVSRSNNLYKSTDGGTTFTKIDYPFESSISSIEINNNDNSIVYVTLGGFYSNGVMKSKDGGVNWNDIDLNLPSEPKFIIKHQKHSPDNDLYVGTSLGVYHINDKMSQWEVFSNNLPNVPVKDLEINIEDEILTAGTYGRGVWQTPIVVKKAGKDVSLLQVVNNNTVSCGGIIPKIIVKNNGLNDINTVDINYNIDGTDYTHQFKGNITSDQTQEIVLPEHNGLDFGEHQIQVEATINGDAFSDNNTLSAVFLSNNSSSGKYINTFGDVNPDEWMVETKGNSTQLWQRGISTTAKFKDLTKNAYITNPTGNYTDETTSYLISPCYDLSKMENPVLKFKMAFDIEENWDVLYMEYTTDQGHTWNILGNESDPNWYNSSYINVDRPITVGKQWTGTQSELKEYSYNLFALKDEKNIIFRFVFATDQATNGEGALIDDFTIDATTLLAVNNFEKKNFTLYPNPSRGSFFIQREGNEEMQISVYDLTGKMVYRKNGISQNFYEFNLDHLSKGIYFIKIIQGNQQAAKRLILE